MADDSVSVLTSASELNTSADLLSSDDLAWIDSCLVKEPDLLSADWSAVKDAMMEILGLQPELQDPSVPTTVDYHSAVVSLEAPSMQNGDMLAKRGGEDIDDVPGNKEMEIDYERLPAVDETATASSEPFGGEDSEATVIDAFQPHYREDNERVIVLVDTGLDFDFSPDDPAEDIFKVWDLGIPDEAEEVDELAEQLNKAMSGSSSVQAEPLTYVDSKELTDLKEEPLVDLIAGIKGLNLD